MTCIPRPVRRTLPARPRSSAYVLLPLLLATGCATAAPRGGERLPQPTVVPHEQWEAQPPVGHAAEAERRNLAPGDSLVFRDLVIALASDSVTQEVAGRADSLAGGAGGARVHPEPDSTPAGVEPAPEAEAEPAGDSVPEVEPDPIPVVGEPAPGSVLLVLRQGDEAVRRWVSEGSAFDWGGYHVAVIAVHEPGELGGGLTALEVATVASLPPEVAESDTAGGAAMRLRIPHRITHITLHHSGSAEPLRPEDDVAEKLRGLQSWGASDRNWWDVPYHFLIGLDGTIYEGRDYRYVGETNTRYDPTGHLLISVVGNYGVQEPTPAQLEAIADLMAWGVSEFDVPLERIGGHYDYAGTTCPGRHLVRYLEDGTFRRMVEGRLGIAPVSAGPPPAPAREFRALWVATVANIDWPSEPGLPVAAQKEELLRLMDGAASANFNAIILQVRTAGDALYASPLEPWSEYLTGRQGRPPEPAYDPLAFAVEAAHERGLELHAWFNPYRARHPSADGPLAPAHLAERRPDLVHEYGTHLWMDPGEPEVQDHTMAVVLDVVRRYDIDGIHIDDYFYPYRERDAAGREIVFPDQASWEEYKADGGTLTRGDWRRHNVDRLIERMYREVKAEKPWVKVGISPFGLWRPGYPDPVCCFDPYQQIYADSRTWLANGWLDYFTPQLYWPIGQTEQSYGLLLGWWAEHNVHDRNLWPGSFAGRVRDDSASDGWPARELLAQIYLQRAHPGASGTVHFSGRYLIENPDGVVDSLRTSAFARPALVPASPWLGGDAPARPEIALESAGEDLTLRLRPGDDRVVRVWVVRVLRQDGWTVALVPGDRRRVPLGRGADRVVVSAVGRFNNESAAASARPSR